MSDAQEPRDDATGEFDETNGLAGDLDGDDGGAGTGDDDSQTGGFFTNALSGDDVGDGDTAETNYSEEGRP